MRLISLSFLALGAVAGCLDPAAEDAAEASAELGATASFANEAGQASTISRTGVIDTTAANPFFRSFGENGRTCASCHVPSENWSITPAGVRARFERTDGLDPIFRTNDGSNAPNADVSTVSARRKAYSMLLDKGLIRVGMPLPPQGEIELVKVEDPYRFASDKELSLFRRPLPTTNLAYLTATMWDGRESTPVADPLAGPNPPGDLHVQANSATVGHAEARSPLPESERKAIADFQRSIVTAQSSVRGVKLFGAGATGGAQALLDEPFYYGINDVLAGDSRTKAPFNPRAMTLFDGWSGSTSSSTTSGASVRQAIARGQELFNTKKINIRGVRGVNDALGVETLEGTCTTCHDSPNIGHHSVRLPLDLGLTDASRRTKDMPLYTLCKRKTDAAGKPIAGTCDTSVAKIETTDPGRALVTGKWSDIATFKGPILRGLSGRAPYFHNGLAADLDAVVKFYDERFEIRLTAEDKSDLALFLSAL
jgi:cytochrome c peroxidase